MKWIVLAIIVSIGAYTFLTLHYRKPGRAFQPYSDLRDRANTKRLLDAGYHRLTLEADLPADAVAKASEAAVTAAGAGIPASLRETLVEFPKLPDDILSVSAGPDTNSLFAYPIHFRCSVPDNKRQLSSVELYLRNDEIIVTPDFDHLSGGLLSRTRENLVRVSVPPGALKPGTYHVTLVGAHSSKAWTLQVH